jgi:NDP-mannose synthase
MQAVILAGGRGTRLKPFTTNFPKPLVPIDDMPILEVVLRQLKNNGFNKIIIAVNHLANLIRAFFGNGDKLGLEIEYSTEDTPLGTAGPLRLIKNLEDTFLVMNGDLLTTLKYSDFYNYHIVNNYVATIGTFKKEIKIDLGVLDIQNSLFVNYIEKPTYYFQVSMGIYVFNKDVIESIPENIKFDMPDLILALKKLKKKIGCYRGDYEWLDIGRIDDYEIANERFKQYRSKFLPHG